MLSYQARRAKFLVKMLKTERPRIICIVSKTPLIPSMNGGVGLGIDFVEFH